MAVRISRTVSAEPREIIVLMMATVRAISIVLSTLLFPIEVFAQLSGQQQPEFIQQGQQLMREGKMEEALALYRSVPETSPNSLAANIAAGSVLDLMGWSEEAHTYFKKAIDAADTPEHKAMAQRAMAISRAFEANCDKTIEYERRVFDYYGSVKNFYQQGEIADEAGRICLDSDDLHNRFPSDDLNTAYIWYQRGHDAGLREPDIEPARVDLWEFRWENAQARIAARRGDRAEAEKHVAAAKAVLDKGTNPEQALFFPYLVGYVAFFERDYRTALDELSKANQNDPFIQCLMGQAYEKLGDREEAVALYRKAAATTFHNPPAAYAVPFSRKRLTALGLISHNSSFLDAFPF